MYAVIPWQSFCHYSLLWFTKDFKDNEHGDYNENGILSEKDDHFVA